MDTEQDDVDADTGGEGEEHEGLLDRVKDWLTDDPPLPDRNPDDEVPFILPPAD